MKTVKIIAAAVLCGALSFSAFGETTQVAQQSTAQQAKPVQLAWHRDGRHHGDHHYRHHCHRVCWTDHYGYMHCRCRH